jgi:DNA polymerase III epsilon subunit-like protein
MNFYVDFEATQPEQEIIAVGVYSDNECSFSNLVRPQFSMVNKYIEEMTGITNEMLQYEIDLDTVFNALYWWCHTQEEDLTKWKFYSYGDADVDFIKHSLCNIKSEKALIIASLMIATLQAYSKVVREYFCGNTSLIKAYNYLKDLENKQCHNALEDAKMLADVFMRTFDKEPLTKNPFVEEASNDYTFPSGKFYCKSTGKNAKEREFYSIHDAIEWIINNRIPQDARPNVRRDKMATKIMKAIRKKETYMQFKWRREK